MLEEPPSQSRRISNIKACVGLRLKNVDIEHDPALLSPPVTRERSFYVFILGGGGYVGIAGKVGKKIGDFGFSHLERMAILVIENEAPNPIAIDALGSQTEMLSPDDIADLVEEFRLVSRAVGGYVPGHVPQYEKFPLPMQQR